MRIRTLQIDKEVYLLHVDAGGLIQIFQTGINETPGKSQVNSHCHAPLGTQIRRPISSIKCPFDRSLDNEVRGFAIRGDLDQNADSNSQFAIYTRIHVYVFQLKNSTEAELSTAAQQNLSGNGENTKSKPQISLNMLREIELPKQQQTSHSDSISCVLELRSCFVIGTHKGQIIKIRRLSSEALMDQEQTESDGSESVKKLAQLIGLVDDNVNNESQRMDVESENNYSHFDFSASNRTAHNGDSLFPTVIEHRQSESEQSLFIGTSQGQVIEVSWQDLNPVRLFGSARLAANSVHSIQITNNQLIVGTVQGLSEYHRLTSELKLHLKTPFRCHRCDLTQIGNKVHQIHIIGQSHHLLTIDYSEWCSAYDNKDRTLNCQNIELSNRSCDSLLKMVPRESDCNFHVFVVGSDGAIDVIFNGKMHSGVVLMI